MKKQTKYDKIITLYNQGMKQSEIIKKLKCGKSTVYNAVRKFRKAEEIRVENFYNNEAFKSVGTTSEISQAQKYYNKFMNDSVQHVYHEPILPARPVSLERIWKQFFMGLFK